MKTKKCLICNVDFVKSNYISNKNWEMVKYCSINCSSKSKENKKTATCDYCKKVFNTRPSHFNKKNRHFCSTKCYSLFRKEKLSFSEQNNYKGVRKEGESKQVYHRNYCKKNKANIAHLKARRYAREKGAIGSHTLKEWESLKKLFDNKCAICNLYKKLSKDHIIPLSKGGSDYIENIQPLCKNCNSKKHNKINYIYENPDLLK